MPVRQEGLLRDVRTLIGSGAIGGLPDAQLLAKFASRSGEASEDAFTALVQRHGPMVLRACRGILRDEHAAQDAFQAAFVVLARKARRLWVRDSLGPWLHRVACRVAGDARKAEVRRQAHERTAADRVAGASAVEGRPSGSAELLAVLHEEIGRLTAAHRAVVVLCDLEGHTHEQAAHELGCPVGTVKSRQARARERLRVRLTVRGLAPSVGLVTVALTAEARASVPAPLAAATVSAAYLAIAGQGTRSLSAVVAALTTWLTGGMSMNSVALIWPSVGAAVLGLALVVPRVSALRGSDEPHKPAAAPVTAKANFGAGATTLPAGAAPGAAATVPVIGTVVDPDGRPAPGVTVLYSVLPVGLVGWSRVVTETRTDAAGRFRLEAPAAPWQPRGPLPGAVWAYRPGALIGSFRVILGTLPAGVPVALFVGPPAHTAFEVRGPDGRPVPGARITPRVLNRDYLSAPDGLAERVGAETVTDARGRAVMTAFLPEEVSTVFVEAEGFGRQQFGFGSRDVTLGTEAVTLGTKAVTLLPVGRVVGRLVGDAGAVRGQRLLVATNSPAHPAPYPGLFEVTTDAQGRFEVAAIPAGNLIISPLSQPGPPWVTPARRGPAVEAGRTTEVEVRTVKGVLARGVVRERGTGRPVEGASVQFGLQGLVLTTDAQGLYKGLVPPGPLTLRTYGIPAGFARPQSDLPEVKVTEGVAEHELPTIELGRAVAVRGVVTDSRGTPLSGVEVEAVWPVDEGPGRRSIREAPARSDARGEFTVDGVPPGADVELTAHRGGLSTPGPVVARAGSAGPVRLVLDGARAAALSGRVVDGGGHPVVGARVHLRARERRPHGAAVSLVDFGGSPILMTDGAGRYQTPRELDSETEYSVYAAAEGFSPGRAPWVVGSQGNVPDLVLVADREE